jgi:copper resistance protein B
MSGPTIARLVGAVGVAVLAMGLPAPAFAQGMDHSTMDHSKMHHAPPAEEPPKPKPKPKPKAKKAKPAPVDHAAMDHSTMDHSTMDHSTMDHSTMDHSTMDHSAMDHSTMHQDTAPSNEPRTPIPELTAEDRAAAFPEVAAHPAHDRSRHSYWLLDRLEAAHGDDGTGVDWKASAWVGGDINRLWLRSEGESLHGTVEHADLEVLGGHAISPWWDLVAGIRHDVGEGPSQTFAAVGVTGLAPYKIELEATAYLGDSGQTAARLEASYDTLLTNRLIVQWHAEANLYGKRDERREVGAGLSTLEAGVRLRYEITRQFAPYVGLAWDRAFGGTADFRRDRGDDAGDFRVVAGVRVWF